MGVDPGIDFQKSPLAQICSPERVGRPCVQLRPREGNAKVTGHLMGMGCPSSGGVSFAVPPLCLWKQMEWSMSVVLQVQVHIWGSQSAA